MGMDIDGSMMVGCYVEELFYDEDDFENTYEYLESLGLETLSPYYASEIGERFCGFYVSDVPIANIDKWLLDVKEKAKEFESLTGQEANLVGMQDVW